MALFIKDRCLAYSEPMWFLAVAVYGTFIVLIDALLFTKRPSELFDIPKLKDRIFGQFWLRVGPTFAARDEETVIPGLVAEASGVVIELGPGMGSQIPRYKKSKVTKIYGIEPNANLHDALRTRIKNFGLDGVYEIVPYGIEDVSGLRKHGISLNSVDTVLSVQVLCSVPDPDEIMHRLHALLKPGGQFIVYEHVQSKDLLSRIVQNFYNIFWPFFLGNCHLDRDTRRAIMQAGSWEKIELAVPSSEDAWMVFPRISGKLFKALGY